MEQHLYHSSKDPHFTRLDGCHFHIRYRHFPDPHRCCRLQVRKIFFLEAYYLEKCLSCINIRNCNVIRQVIPIFGIIYLMKNSIIYSREIHNYQQSLSWLNSSVMSNKVVEGYLDTIFWCLSKT